MRLNKFFEFVQSDFEPIKSFYIKDELNPKLWEDFKLDVDVRKQLLQIAEDFFEDVEIETDIIDIVFVGSLCNYNWSDKYSDFDLHLIISHSDVDDNEELVEKFCDYAKKIWNNKHDIVIKGYDVEIMLQDIKSLKLGLDTGRIGGAFSLMNNKWIKKPVKIDFVPDETMIRKKAETIMDTVDGIDDSLNEDDYKLSESNIKKVWSKIKKYRQSGLETESGELSIGNLVFKLLRRNGYINKVMDMRRMLYDKQFK